MSEGSVTIEMAAHEGRLLSAHLGRLCGWDPHVLVRAQGRGKAIGVYAAPPMDVLSFVALPILGPDHTPEFDTTVAASTLRQAMQDHDEHVEIRLPEPLVGGEVLAVLPPSEGWQLPIPGVSGDLVPVVDEAIAEFRSRAASVPDSDRLAREIWDRPGFGGLPLRVLHAARRLGFLTDDASRVSAATCTGWKRLTTVRGQVFIRTVPPTARPSLAVVR